MDHHLLVNLTALSPQSNSALSTLVTTIHCSNSRHWYGESSDLVRTRTHDPSTLKNCCRTLSMSESSSITYESLAPATREPARRSTMQTNCHSPPNRQTSLRQRLANSSPSTPSHLLLLTRYAHSLTTCLNWV